MARECARRRTLGGGEDACLRRDGRQLERRRVHQGGRTGRPLSGVGDGHPESLSPDGKWVLARAGPTGTSWGREWSLLPTGPGSPRVLPRGAITQLVEGPGCQMESAIVFTAIEEGRAARVYLQDVETGHMRPITPERVHMPEKAATPDGKSVLVWLDGALVPPSH